MRTRTSTGKSKTKRVPAKGVSSTQLQQRAKKRLVALARGARKPIRKRKSDAKTLQSELAIYEVELELQNAQLRETQHSLEAARSWYSSLFELAPVPYIIIHSDHTIKEVNFAAAQLLCTDRLRCRSARVASFIDLESQRELWNHLEEVFKGSLGERRSASIRLQSVNGLKRELELYSFLVRHSAKEDSVCLTVCVDVTERNRVLLEMEHAKRQAEAATVAKAEFLSNMSHEMKTPLSSIMMYAQMVNRPQFSDAKKAEFLDSIVRNARHLNGLVGDILDIAKSDADKIKIEVSRVDAHALLREVIHTLSPLANPKQVDLKLDVAADVPRWVMTDPTRVKQILINVVGNSVKFTQSGFVSLEVTVEHEVGHSLLKLVVRDTGIGIPAHRKEHLFEQFTQLDGSSTRSHMGTGLGLYLSRKLARLLGGDVELISTVLDKGSVFCIRLPCLLA